MAYLLQSLLAEFRRVNRDTFDSPIGRLETIEYFEQVQCLDMVPIHIHHGESARGISFRDVLQQYDEMVVIMMITMSQPNPDLPSLPCPGRLHTCLLPRYCHDREGG